MTKAFFEFLGEHGLHIHINWQISMGGYFSARLTWKGSANVVLMSGHHTHGSSTESADEAIQNLMRNTEGTTLRAPKSYDDLRKNPWDWPTLRVPTFSGKKAAA